MADRDPLNLASLVSQYAAEDFVAQRKRLRDARMRWIEENECPTAYQVTTKDKDGNEKTFATPFQIGQIKYPDKYDDKWKEEGQQHHDPQAEKELLEGIEAIISESSTEKRLTILVTGNEQHAFLTGGGDDSPYPPMNEGEGTDEYFARVAHECEQAAAAGRGTATRQPGSNSDSVWKSTPVDPLGVGSADVPGAGLSRHAGTMLGGDPDTLRPGDQDGAGGSDTVPAPGAAPAPAGPD